MVSIPPTNLPGAVGAAIPGGYGATNYAATGLGTYPPGSQMATFVDSINSITAKAAQMADVSSLGLPSPTGRGSTTPYGTTTRPGSTDTPSNSGSLVTMFVQMIAQILTTLMSFSKGFGQMQ